MRPLAPACLAVFTSCAVQAEFRGLGFLSGGDFYSGAYGVSADGQVLVGFSEDASSTQAVRWSADGTLVSLGLPGLYSSAQAASADGREIVGYFEHLGRQVGIEKQGQLGAIRRHAASAGQHRRRRQVGAARGDDDADAALDECRDLGIEQNGDGRRTLHETAQMAIERSDVTRSRRC